MGDGVEDIHSRHEQRQGNDSSYHAVDRTDTPYCWQGPSGERISGASSPLGPASKFTGTTYERQKSNSQSNSADTTEPLGCRTPNKDPVAKHRRIIEEGKGTCAHASNRLIERIIDATYRACREIDNGRDSSDQQETADGRAHRRDRPQRAGRERPAQQRCAHDSTKGSCRRQHQEISSVVANGEDCADGQHRSRQCCCQPSTGAIHTDWFRNISAGVRERINGGCCGHEVRRPQDPVKSRLSRSTSLPWATNTT